MLDLFKDCLTDFTENWLDQMYALVLEHRFEGHRCKKYQFHPSSTQEDCQEFCRAIMLDLRSLDELKQSIKEKVLPKDWVLESHFDQVLNAQPANAQRIKA